MSTYLRSGLIPTVIVRAMPVHFTLTSRCRCNFSLDASLLFMYKVLTLSTAMPPVNLSTLLSFPGLTTTLSLLAQASSGVIQSLHPQLRLKQPQLRLATVTGIGREKSYVLLWGYSEATDARDKVYALLGLLDYSLRESTLLQPGYSKKVVDVYVDALRDMIQIDRDGSSLRDLVGSINQPLAKVDEEFSPWVPQWDIAVTKELTRETPPRCLFPSRSFHGVTGDRS